MTLLEMEKIRQAEMTLNREEERLRNEVMTISGADLESRRERLKARRADVERQKKERLEEMARRQRDIEWTFSIKFRPLADKNNWQLISTDEKEKFLEVMKTIQHPELRKKLDFNGFGTMSMRSNGFIPK